ncbi:MAG: rhodanese-like domain-containing protein [Legionellales bacterium]|nr:rhodanese-like domain-containing protein [Legionellales bacterium]
MIIISIYNLTSNSSENTGRDFTYCRDLVDLYNDRHIKETLVFRGCVALNKLIYDPACILCQQKINYEHLAHHHLTICGETMIQEIDVNELKCMMENNDKFTLLDVRQPEENVAGNIGGLLIPLGELESRLDELNKDDKIVVYCKVGGRSMMAARILQQHGFEHVINLQGGYLSWVN